MRVKVAIGMRPLGSLDNCITSCHVTCPSRKDKSLHVFNTEYKSLSFRPVDEKEEMLRQSRSL